MGQILEREDGGSSGGADNNADCKNTHAKADFSTYNIAGVDAGANAGNTRNNNTNNIGAGQLGRVGGVDKGGLDGANKGGLGEVDKGGLGRANKGGLGGANNNTTDAEQEAGADKQNGFDNKKNAAKSHPLFVILQKRTTEKLGIPEISELRGQRKA